MHNFTNITKNNRAELREFYKGFDRPIINMTAKAKARKLYRYAKWHHESFFLLSLYAIAKAANSVPEYREREVDGMAVRFDKVDVVTPIMTKGGAFQEVCLEYKETFKEFKESAMPIVNAAKNSDEIYAGPNSPDRILISCVPWVHFDAYTSPDYDFHQDMPIITYGKFEDGTVPVNARVSHVFVDGMHLGKFFGEVEKNFANPKSL